MSASLPAVSNTCPLTGVILILSLPFGVPEIVNPSMYFENSVIVVILPGVVLERVAVPPPELSIANTKSDTSSAPLPVDVLNIFSSKVIVIKLLFEFTVVAVMDGTCLSTVIVDSLADAVTALGGLLPAISV